MNPKSIRKTLIASSIALTLGAATNAEAALVTGVFGDNAWSTDSANFTMLDPNGYVAGGTNDVKFTWDGNAYTSSSDYTGPGGASNVTASSTTPFLGHAWSVHDFQVFVPGSYSFNTSLGGGNPESGTMTMNVGFNQIGMHMLFNWNGSLNIDAVEVANITSVFGAGIGNTAHPGCNSGPGATIKNCLYDGGNYGSAGMPNAGNLWMLSSSDGNGDGIMGTPMAAGGPLAGDNVNFNGNVSAVQVLVPVPAAVWLFGSGLIGLLGAVKRRKH